MSWDSVPWFIGGGAQHSPEVARLLAYAATSGAEGLIEPGDLKVAALSVPGGSVTVSPGAALIRNRATGGAQQTYVARNPIQDVVQIAATGGAKRSDLIVAQIEDPFMAGEPWQDPADPTVGPYVFTRVIPNVPAGTTRLQDVPAYSGRSAVVLARVDVPASTGTITSGMIKDLRKLALPRQERQMILWQHSGAARNLTSTSWVDWPGAKWSVDVPEWATHAAVLGQVFGAVQTGGGTALGEAQLRFDGQNGPASTWDINSTASNGNGARVPTVAMSWSAPLSAAARGTSRTFEIWGHSIKIASTDTGYLVFTGGTQVSLDVEFIEKPV